jgi:hypothetical protein
MGRGIGKERRGGEEMVVEEVVGVIIRVKN